MGARTAALTSAELFTDGTECTTGRRAGITLTDECTGSLWEDVAGMVWRAATERALTRPPAEIAA